MRFSRCSDELSHPDASMDDLSTLRRSFRTRRLPLCLTRGSTPGWYAVPRWGAPKACQPGPAQPTQNPSGAVSGRSEPWRRTPNPLAHSPKVHPPQSLLSERRPDAAEPRPPKTRAERCRAGASLGGEHPNPLAHSAKVHLPQSLLSERRPDAADNVAERCRAGASLGGEHPTPSRKARKLLLPRAYSANGGLIPWTM